MKIDIYAGFLGAGKTTLIKKMIAEGYGQEKIVLIENEFGEIDVDSGFLQESGVEIRGLKAGCICCSLVGDFTTALQQVIADYAPDRIVIEPSGVGKLTDVLQAVSTVCTAEITVDHVVSVVNAKKLRMYLRNFNEFYANQLATAHTIVCSRTQEMSAEKMAEVIADLRALNPTAPIVTTPWEQLTGAQLCDAMAQPDSVAQQLAQLQADAHAHHHEHHEHHHHEHHEDCGCGHAHHEHHEHHHHEECACGHEHHEHHHDHAHHDHHASCTCGCGHDHHDHQAAEVFQSWGMQTTKQYAKIDLEGILQRLNEQGNILRAKGCVQDVNGGWLHFDYVPDEWNVRAGGAVVAGCICVIGAGMDTQAVADLF